MTPFGSPIATPDPRAAQAPAQHLASPPVRRGRLNRRGAFSVAVLTIGVSLWTSGAPTITYPVYERTWHVTPAEISAVFATFPAVLVLVLAFFGGISDAIGRSRAILIGLCLMTLGVLTFAAAANVGWLFAGRVLTGAGVGLALSPATASLAEHAAPGKEKQAGAISSVAAAAGLSTATVLTGGLIGHGPDPLHSSFKILLAVLVAVTALAVFLPATSATMSWQLRWPHVDRQLCADVVASTFAVSTAYTGGAVLLSLGAVTARTLIGTTDPFVVGAVIAISSASTGVTGLIARNAHPRRAIPCGAVAMVLGFGTLVAAGSTQSLALFLTAMPLLGVGYGLLSAGGVGRITARAPQQQRASTLSVVFLGSNAVSALVAAVLGEASSREGLRPALLLAASFIALLGALATSACARRRSGPGQ